MGETKSNCGGGCWCWCLLSNYKIFVIMKMNVGYVQCYEQPTDSSLDSTLIRVMTCNNVENGGSVQTVYQNGETQILYPKDPIVYDTPPPPPPPLPDDQPAESLTVSPTESLPETTATNEAGSGNNALLIGGGLLLLFLLFGKNKKKKRK